MYCNTTKNILLQNIKLKWVFIFFLNLKNDLDPNCTTFYLKKVFQTCLNDLYLLNWILRIYRHFDT